jgi:hypothetical protein
MEGGRDIGKDKGSIYTQRENTKRNTIRKKRGEEGRFTPSLVRGGG